MVCDVGNVLTHLLTKATQTEVLSVLCSFNYGPISNCWMVVTRTWLNSVKSNWSNTSKASPMLLVICSKIPPQLCSSTVSSDFTLNSWKTDTWLATCQMGCYNSKGHHETNTSSQRDHISQLSDWEIVNQPERWISPFYVLFCYSLAWFWPSMMVDPALPTHVISWETLVPGQKNLKQWKPGWRTVKIRFWNWGIRVSLGKEFLQPFVYYDNNNE